MKSGKMVVSHAYMHMRAYMIMRVHMHAHAPTRVLNEVNILALLNI